jgi:hypothetical protein
MHVYNGIEVMHVYNGIYIDILDGLMPMTSVPIFHGTIDEIFTTEGLYDKLEDDIGIDPDKVWNLQESGLKSYLKDTLWRIYSIVKDYDSGFLVTERYKKVIIWIRVRSIGESIEFMIKQQLNRLDTYEVEY